MKTKDRLDQKENVSNGRKMRPLFFLAVCMINTLTLFPQEIRHDALSINIEVPVRVYKGNTFVDFLTIEDFELYENGVLQTIDAVYLIKKTSLEREDSRIDTQTAKKIFSPRLSRQFVLIFEIKEVFVEVEQAIRHFFDNVLVPSDKLLLATPLKTYSFKENSWEFVPKEEMADQMIERLRKDTLVRPVDWGNLDDYINDEMNRKDMEDVYFGQRYIDEENISNIAEYLKSLPGQKNVFLFLQQELIDYSMPTEFSTVTQIMSNLDYMTILSRIASYGEVSNRAKKAFADPTILFNLIYLKNRKEQTVTSLSEKIDVAAGMFGTFEDLSEITGGLTETTINAEASFKKAVDASENYYLLYYTPKNYKADGKFKRIKIKIKGQNYRIIHRTGYIAD
jgi:VWFA-related protein